MEICICESPSLVPDLPCPFVAHPHNHRQGVIIDNWIEDDVAIRTVGKNLIGNESVPFQGSSTSRDAFSPDKYQGVAPPQRMDVEPRAILELRHKFPHGPTREQQDAFYDATVGGFAFAPPSGDKPQVTSSLWSGSNRVDATVPVNGGRTSFAARKKAQAAAEMAGFDPYVTTTRTALEHGLSGGAYEKRRADPPAPSRGGWGNDLGDDAGAQSATIGRKGKGAFCAEFDRRAIRQVVDLRGAIAIKDGPWAGK